MRQWKRIAALAAVAVLGLAGITAFAAEAGTYSWQGHEIEVTAVEKGGMFAPADMKDDEYCVSVYMTVDDELWQDDDLGHALYADTALTDPEGNRYAPQAALRGTKEPTRTYMFCIPKGIETADLSLQFGSEPETWAVGTAGFVWDGMAFELTELSEELTTWEKPQSAPGGKWLKAVFTITDGEMEMGALEDHIYGEEGIRLNGTDPKVVSAVGIRITDDMKAVAMGTFNVIFDVPKDLNPADASVTVGGETALPASAKSEEAADESADEEDGSVKIVTDSGAELTLTPLAPDAFAAQEDRVIVHTRIGTTVHKSGSQFTAGSGMSLKNMRNTVQYGEPKAVFAYDTDMEFDAAADAIGEIGKTASLIVDGTSVPVQVAWITTDMACFIFDCDADLESVPVFRLQDGALEILP